MQASQLPNKFPIPFANNAGAGYIRTIPQASQIGVTNGAASLTDGFPPLCFLPLTAGGVPPSGLDFNGILNEITQWNQWQQMGGLTVYDSVFSGEIGGYPKGALVASTTAGALWLNTTDNNATNPDSGGTGWVALQIAASGGSTQKAPKLIGANVAGSATSMATSTNTLLAMTVSNNNLSGTSSWDAGTSTLTVGTGEAGLWFISAYCWFLQDAAAFQSVSIRVNGSQILNGTSNPGSGNGGVANISGVVELSVGDTVTFYGYQQSGSTYNTQGQGASMFLISAY